MASSIPVMSSCLNRMNYGTVTSFELYNVTKLCFGIDVYVYFLIALCSQI